MIDENNPHSNIETADFWLEDDIFDKKDEKNITDFSNELLKIINENNLFLDFNIPTEKIIEDIFGDDTKNNVTIEDVTDDENIRKILPSDVESISEPEEIIVTTANTELDPKNTTVSANIKPRKYNSTQYNNTVRAANKIKNKYKKKIIGKINNKNTGKN